jgi:hypothetical protein
LITDAAAGDKLIGYLGGLSYNPDMSQGGFGYSYENAVEMPWVGNPEHRYDFSVDEIYDESVYGETRETRTTNQSLYIPKKLSLSFEFTVLHQHLNGWRYDSLNGGYVFGDRYVNDSYPHMPSMTTIETATTIIYAQLPEEPSSSTEVTSEELLALSRTRREPGPIIRQRAIDILDRDYGIED